MGVTSLGRHIRPACHQALFEMFIKKSWFWPPYSVFFMDFWGCEGSGATFHGLRMRSSSTRKCAHRNAGDLGSSLAVCAFAYRPIHVTAQGKSLGPNCACVLSARHYRGLPMNAYVLFPMPDSCTLIGRERSREQIDDVPYANESRDPLKQYFLLSLLRSDWLVPEVALYTTVHSYCV